MAHEALLCGTPVVLERTGGFLSQVTKKKNYLLFTSTSVHILALVALLRDTPVVLDRTGGFLSQALLVPCTCFTSTVYLLYLFYLLYELYEYNT
jgi:hypothetical protein